MVSSSRSGTFNPFSLSDGFRNSEGLGRRSNRSQSESRLLVSPGLRAKIPCRDGAESSPKRLVGTRVRGVVAPRKAAGSSGTNGVAVSAQGSVRYDCGRYVYVAG
jgi:hypothetical protein